MFHFFQRWNKTKVNMDLHMNETTKWGYCAEGQSIFLESLQAARSTAANPQTCRSTLLTKDGGTPNPLRKIMPHGKSHRRTEVRNFNGLVFPFLLTVNQHWYFYPLGFLFFLDVGSVWLRATVIKLVIQHYSGRIYLSSRGACSSLESEFAKEPMISFYVP